MMDELNLTTYGDALGPHWARGSSVERRALT